MNSVSPHFGAASRNTIPSDTQSGMSFMALLIAVLFKPDDVDTVSKFNKYVDEVFKDLAAQPALVTERVSQLRDFATDRNNPDRQLGISDVVSKYTAGLNIPRGTLLNPDLLHAMEKDPAIRGYVDMTFKAAAKYGIDGTLLANQFWQESNFKNSAVSSEGAKGIAQFTETAARKYGIYGHEGNAEKSIEAGAHYMADLTKRFGDQRLALVAYNGGGKAIEFVEKKLGHQVTAGEWMAYMAERRRHLPRSDAGAWHNETFNYVAKIDSTFWTEDKRNASAQALASMTPHTTDVVLARNEISDTHKPGAPRPVL